MVAAAPADPCLVLYPLVRWERILQQLEDAPRKDGAFRRFRRHFLAQAEEASCDAQGRLVIPPLLRAKAGLEREAVCVGANTRIEIWKPERLAASEPDARESEQFATELGVD
jgi:MraZ protein